MKRISIVSEVLNNQGVTIIDDNGIPVTICEKSQFKFNPAVFTPPSILVDNFERRKYKDIEIKIIDLEYLNKLGYRLVSVKCNSRIRNFPRQLQSYILEAHMRPIPNSQILRVIPKDHLIEFDITNNRVRIKGKGGYPYHRGENATPWVPIIRK